MHHPIPESRHTPIVTGRAGDRRRSRLATGPLDEVQVLGPHNSGTNLMFRYQSQLFGITRRVHRVFGKHSLPPNYLWGGKGCIWSPGAPVPLERIRRSTLFLCMVRRPYFWLLSTCRRPYLIAFLDGRGSFSDKIRSRIRFQEKIYDSLVDLWNAYYRAYEEHLEPFRTLYVRLEDLVETPKPVLLELHDYLAPIPDVDLDQLITAVANRPAKRHGGDCVYGEEAKREYQEERVRERISAADLEFIDRQLDLRLMRKFRYRMESRSRDRR